MAETVQASGSHDDAASIAATIVRLRPGLRMTREEIEQALDPEHFVRIRNIPGGPAPEQTADALKRAQEQQRKFESWIESKNAMLDAARASLH